MDMITCSVNFGDTVPDTDEFVEIAAFLSRHFLKPMYHFSNEKGYHVYVGCMDELLNWADEFYNMYYRNNNSYGTSENSGEKITHIYNDNILMNWGNEKIKQFFCSKCGKNKIDIVYGKD